MTVLKDHIDEADRTHDIRDVLQTQKKTMVCPLPQHVHSSNTPSFSIYWRNGKQWWKCHGSCGLEGDLVDLVGYLRIADYNPRNTNKVQEALQLVDERYSFKVVEPPDTVTLDGNEWMKYPLDQKVIEYGRMRGLDKQTLEKFKIGHATLYGYDWMTIPAFANHKLMGVKLRNIQLCEKRNRYVSIKGGLQTLFNFDFVKYHVGQVLIVKAEIPCMLLDQLGFYACAPTGGEGGWNSDWRMALALSHNVVIGDNDEPGRKLGERRAALLNADLKFPPAQFKDWDEWYLTNPNEAIQVTKSLGYRR